MSGVDDVTANLKKKGRNADGLIRVRGQREVEPSKPARLSRSLINECVAETLQREPKTRERLQKGKLKRKDLEARVIEKHGRKVD